MENVSAGSGRTHKRNNVLIITTATEHKNEKLKQSKKKLKRNIFMRNAFHCVLCCVGLFFIDDGATVDQCTMMMMNDVEAQKKEKKKHTY